MARLNVKPLALLLVVLATVISATVHKVTVGSDDDNTFSPSVLNVKVNDKIIFKLVSGLHGVFLSDKPNSCVKSAKIKHPVILPRTDKVGKSATLTITKDLPSKFGFFCDLHCGGGMSGSINVRSKK